MGIDVQAVVFAVGANGCHRTGEVVLLHGTVTDDHHVAQCLCILFKSDGKRWGYSHVLGFVTDVRNLELLALVCFDYEVTVEVGNHTVVLSHNADSGTDDGFSGSIFHMALHSDLLCKGTH